MVILNYADWTDTGIIVELCKTEKVIFDFKLYDIPNTMRRNIKTCAKWGGYAVTIADHPYNDAGIIEARKSGRDYGIKIIVGDVDK